MIRVSVGSKRGRAAELGEEVERESERERVEHAHPSKVTHVLRRDGVSMRHGVSRSGSNMPTLRFERRIDSCMRIVHLGPPPGMVHMGSEEEQSARLRARCGVCESFGIASRSAGPVPAVPWGRHDGVMIRMPYHTEFG